MPCNAWNHPLECTCGWGGDGHLGRRSGGMQSSSTAPMPPANSLWCYERDFCAPSTCRYCRGPVFFIRHNNGSVWIEPPLGPPWDKHACYYESVNAKPPEIPRWMYYFWKETSSLSNGDLPMGIITKAKAKYPREGDERPARIILEIDCGKGNRIYIATDAIRSTAIYLIGQIAIVDLKNQSLITSKQDRRPILDGPVDRREF